MRNAVPNHRAPVLNYIGEKKYMPERCQMISFHAILPQILDILFTLVIQIKAELNFSMAIKFITCKKEKQCSSLRSLVW